MANLEDSDDDFLVPTEEAFSSALKSLKRLRKGVLKKLETRQTFSAEQDSKESERVREKGTSIGCEELQLAENHMLESEFDEEENVGGEESSEIELDVEEKTDDLDDREEERGNDSEENDDSEEEDVDEDDEAAVLNLLSKETKVLKQSPQKPLDDTPKEGSPLSKETNVLKQSPQKPLDDTAKVGSPESKGKARKRKETMSELEEMHARSQRLLRETSHVSFKCQQSTAGKSISSVLEKIRMRKVQLLQGLERKPSLFFEESIRDVVPEETESELSSSKKDSLLDLKYDGDLPIEDSRQQDQENQLNEAEQLHDGANRIHQEAQETVQKEAQDFAVEENRLSRSSESRMEGNGSHENVGNEFLGSGSAFRAPMEDTQDLFCHSQSGHEADFDEMNVKCLEGGVLGCGSQVNLRLDTETQDDVGWSPDEDCSKDNISRAYKERSKPANLEVAPIRALIDDEAEDEDEDLLGFDDEEDTDDAEFHKDLVTDDNAEKADDMQKRDELHRKWLEQQDAARTEDILERLKTGWVPRESRKQGLNFLEEDDDIFVKNDIDGLKQVDGSQMEPRIDGLPEMPDDNSQDAEDLKDENCHDEPTMARACMETEEVLASSDDDEAGQRLLRQRFLEESEEQEEFVLAAEDESSRKVFGLINKVNVATHKKIKSGAAEIRSLNGFLNSNFSFNSKSSFLRRTASSSLQSGQRQNSSGSGARSFIFGRDDSNSSHGLSNGDQQVEAEIKENLEPSQGLRRHNSDSRLGGKAVKGNQNSSTASSSGPSLFEILKRQATNLDHALQNQNSNAPSNVFPVLTAFKPIKSNRVPRGV